MKDEGDELVKRMHHEACKRLREEEAQQRALVEKIHREAIEQYRKQPRPPYERPTISYTELPEAKPDEPLYYEWNTYRREVGRLLAEGHEGRWILIKGEEIIGIWDTHDEVKVVAVQKYLMQPCLIHQILSREPLLRGPSALWRWRS
jgi:hypothetical protein